MTKISNTKISSAFSDTSTTIKTILTAKGTWLLKQGLKILF